MSSLEGRFAFARFTARLWPTASVFVISDLDIEATAAEATDVICDSFEILMVQLDIAGGVNQMNEVRLLKMCC